MSCILSFCSVATFACVPACSCLMSSSPISSGPPPGNEVSRRTRFFGSCRRFSSALQPYRRSAADLAALRGEGWMAKKSLGRDHVVAQATATSKCSSVPYFRMALFAHFGRLGCPASSPNWTACAWFVCELSVAVRSHVDACRVHVW